LIRSGKVLGDWCDAFEDFCVARSRLTDDVSLACTNQFHTLAAYYPVRRESLIDIDDDTVRAFDAHSHSTLSRSDFVFNVFSSNRTHHRRRTRFKLDDSSTL
jgi:hypothetical protein